MNRFLAVALTCVLVTSPICTAQVLRTHDEAYRLQCSDALDLKYRYTPEFDQVVSIGPDGQAHIAGLGVIEAGGLTLAQFHEELVRLSAVRLKDPDVSVGLKDFVKPFIFVEGEVNTPGRVELRGETSALDAIALAGGFRTSSRPSAVLLLRRDEKGSEQTRVLNLQRILSQHRLEEAPTLQSGDRLYVLQGNFSKIERLVHLGQFGAIYNPIH
jgi:polysaccharide biosynthesis/export protein